MPKLPPISGKKCKRVLLKFGFEEVRQKGSHVVMKKITSDGAIGCVVPMHKEIAQGTLKNILKQAKIEPDSFLKIFNEF